MRPSQNVGSEMPMMLSTVKRRSCQLYCLSAEIIPTGMPMSSSKKMPKSATMSVAGKRCRMADMTGSWVWNE